MAVNLTQARDFVYASGVLRERALFAYLFEDGSLERLHRCLLCHKNADGGWGHALEHDARTPESHPLALEYLLTTQRVLGFPLGDLLAGTPRWLEAQREADGSLRNPPSFLEYPHAPWWNDGGQTMPDSIVGNLTRLGLVTPSLAHSTRQWVTANLTLETIAGNEWLFMAYHAFDYFMSVNDFPNVETFRAETIQNIITCAGKIPPQQYQVLLDFAPTPDSRVALAAPELVARSLDHIATTQGEDGGWHDEHGLPQWYAMVTIKNLLALRRYGRL